MWKPHLKCSSRSRNLCSNPRYSWVTYFILSNLWYFSQLVLSAHPLLFYQFCHLMNLSLSYQISVSFSPLVIYSLFYVILQPINAPAVHTTNTTLFPILLCTRSLRQYCIVSLIGGNHKDQVHLNTLISTSAKGEKTICLLTHQASWTIVPFWYGGIETWVFYKNNLLPSSSIL